MPEIEVGNTAAAEPAEGALMAAYNRAREVWTFGDVSLEVFSKYLEGIGYMGRVPEYPNEVYLCLGCSMGFDEAYRALNDEYLIGARTAIRQLLHKEDDVEDVLQDVRRRLLVGPRPRITSYRGNGPLSTWLRVIVRRAALDHCRAQARRQQCRYQQVQHGRALHDVAKPPDEASLDYTTARVCRASLTASMAALPPHESQMLRHYYVSGLGIDILGRMYGVDRSTAARRIQRTIGRLRQRLVSDLKRNLALSHEEARQLTTSAYERLLEDPPEFLEAAAEGARCTIREPLEAPAPSPPPPSPRAESPAPPH
jgi:RNA polymerase sigma-70 factor